jgi:glutamine synthetase
MSTNARKTAVQTIARHGLDAVQRPTERPRPLPELFSTNVFSDAVQRQRLPRPIYESLRATIDAGKELDPSIADTVANAMKDWAIERGATHFTHWFQPMTGLTAEKHDSFLHPTSEGRIVLEFSGKELIKGEPDASSFPSGGIRATFEARGYTAWDPTVPAFLRETPRGSTLVIPTAFCSWTGEALDKKTPLLRSLEALDRRAVRLLRLIGEKDVERVMATCGTEQEYFLVDRSLYFQRPDLMSCGRTLFGARPAKGQEQEDHYFGVINQRALNFMQELEMELWKLGIPIKTRHNEVAPSQYELAPHFEQTTIATDHNMLTMEILRAVAERHDFACLQHEKPFAGINGSGKHLNWSMADDRGNNLLDPGTTPHDNLKFMLFLTAIIRAVDLHQDLLRVSVATAGNDHRLGANEAPPAIMSIYVGEELQGIIDALVEGTAPAARPGGGMKLGVTTLPELPRDTTDRNRTSPFAFTGNKFEFRAVGSSQSVSYPNLVLNTIVAESLDFVADEIERRGGTGERAEVIPQVVREVLSKHRRVLFSGDNYSGEWTQEAEERGLHNLRDTPAALRHFASDTNVALFEKYGIFSERETRSRGQVLTEKYVQLIHAEFLSSLQLGRTTILPAALTYQHRVAESIAAVQRVSAQIDVGPQVELLQRVAGEVGRLEQALDALAAAGEKGEGLHGAGLEQAEYYRDEVVPAMVAVRASADVLEGLVDDDLWPLPTYRELLWVN